MKTSIDHFNFSDQDKAEARSYFEMADTILAKAATDANSKLYDKLNTDHEIDPKYISDAVVIEEVEDGNGQIVEKERPIVDLVQQGGGMWGIALLGYCYILEKVGIRFYSHGGTSAGAINALFLAAIPSDIYEAPAVVSTNGRKGALKSEILTLIVSKMNFATFMDRGGIAGYLQKLLFKQPKRSLGIIALISLVIIVTTYFLFGFLFNEENGVGFADARYFYFIVGTFNIVAFGILVYVLLTKILGENFGLNSGDVFFKWVEGHLATLGIETTQDVRDGLDRIKLIRDENGDQLSEVKRKSVVVSESKLEAISQQEGIEISETDQFIMQKVNPESGVSKPMESPKLVLISSNLSHNSIVRFPREAEEYWENPQLVQPAAYVRASMSLPFIFKTFIPNATTHYGKKAVSNKVKMKARFVDGGMLSNFPIREFHRVGSKVPSFPTFGVLLSEPKKKQQASEADGPNNSLINYVMSYIKTFRNFYDNDFMENTSEIEMRIAKVDTDGINWLDFWMDAKTKKELFRRGAHAAIAQLEKFDWEAYKKLRQNMGTHGY